MPNQYTDPWSSEEDIVLDDLWRHTGIRSETIGEIVRRPKGSVISRVGVLGLRCYKRPPGVPEGTQAPRRPVDAFRTHHDSRYVERYADRKIRLAKERRYG